MYSWEIDKIIKEKNYELSKEEYFEISDHKKSPQISMIIYDLKHDVITISTDDGYSWPIRFY